MNSLCFQTAYYPCRNHLLYHDLFQVTSGLYYQHNQDSAGQVIYTKGNYVLFCFNFIHAFFVSCYLNACQMGFPTILLRLQKVGWTACKSIIGKKKEVSEIPKYLNAITKDDKLYALYFPSLSF